MNNLLKAKDIMTTYVKTVSPNMKIKEVWDMMIDYGHTGFPVVEDKKLLGIITRADIDKALRHGLLEKKVEEFMSRTPIYVSPYTNVETIKNLFIRYGIGRIMVVENGKLLGIITRTDLLQADKIDLYNNKKRELSVYDKIKSVLPPHVLNLLYKFGEIGDHFGYSVFIVGGVVRDILLGYENLDIDIVVEGDGIKFAKEIEKIFKVQLKIFPQFGTASIKFLNGLRFDIATSRVEFYDYPGAPPKVEISSIKKDLYRRDFTINALAIQINPSWFGRLIDFFGGVYDLEHKLIRILHNLSFIEDPSRILRAIRFETRYNFRIEDKTLYFLKKAVSENYIEKIKSPKLREEFFYILEEKNPLKPVLRLKELDILPHIFPGIKINMQLENAFIRLTKQKPKYKDIARVQYVYFFIMLRFIEGEENLDYVLKKFSISNMYKEKLKEVFLSLNEIYIKLEKTTKKSEIFNLLYRYPLEIVIFLGVFSSNPNIQKKIDEYLFRLREIKPLLSGKDILKFGIKEGKDIGYILSKLRDMKLDGEILNKVDEEKKAKELIESIKGENL